MAEVGDRIRLTGLHRKGEWYGTVWPIGVGDEGIVESIRDISDKVDIPGTEEVIVKWDNGKRITLLTPPDTIMVVYPKDFEKEFEHG